MGGELNFFERSCAGEEEVGCHSNTVDGIVSQKYPKIRNLSSYLQTDHECICRGEGCNQSWETAGETSDPTTQQPTGKTDLRVITCTGVYILAILVPSAMYVSMTSLARLVMLITLVPWRPVLWERTRVA